MRYTEAVAAFIAARRKSKDLHRVSLGVFEDAYLATLCFGADVLALEQQNGSGGFVLTERFPGVPARVFGGRPLAGPAAHGYLRDRGLVVRRIPTPRDFDVAENYPPVGITPVPRWVLSPWKLADVPTSDAYRRAWNATVDVYGQADQAGMIVGPLWDLISKILEAGFLVYPTEIAVLMPGMSVAQATAWTAFAKEATELVRLSYHEELKQLAAELVRLAERADFWNLVHRINLGVATVGISEWKPGGSLAFMPLVIGVTGAALLVAYGMRPRGRR